MKTKLVGILFLVAGVAFSIWLNEVIERKSRFVEQVYSQSLPDYYIKEFVVQGTDETGAPKFQLSAKLMNHYASDDHADLIEPQMKFYTKNNGPEWKVRSQTGRIDSGGNNISLYGEVTLFREAFGNKPPVSIVTRDIHFSPKSNTIHTENFVEYTAGQNKILGEGLKANLNKSNIKLLNKTKGRYVPSKK